MEDEQRVFDRSLVMSGSKSKDSVGEKRAREEVEESPDKHVKMRELESVLRCEDGRTSGTVPSNNLRASSTAVDLNTDIYGSGDVAVNGINVGLQQINPLPSSQRQGMEREITSMNSGGIVFDLNAGDNSSSNTGSFHVYNNYEYLKPKDEPECVSSVAPLDKKDPMKVWKEMKQNGFVSSSHGGVPMPKKRGRKRKNDGIKNKMELAKKEQVDRFAKIAAPSGLLSELNPGIINHVRNSKQVRSIIEALVKSEKLENQHALSKEGDQLKSGPKDSSETKGFKPISGSGVNRFNAAHEAVSVSGLAQSRQMTDHPPSHNNSLSLNSELTGGDDEFSMVEMRAPGKTSCFSHPELDREEDLLALKLSSSTAMASENNSSLSNEDSANLTSVTSLAVNAATVASQWLELLHQDITGRLAALRRSKKRVRAVIQRELPFLLSKEFPPLNDNQSCDKKSCTPINPHNLAADAHRTRWTALFDQMDKTLSEEESQLESWLNKVREMRVYCDQGLLKFHDIYGLQQPGSNENQFRLNKPDSLEEESAVQGAAASIYSTCNILSSIENLPCC